MIMLSKSLAATAIFQRLVAEGSELCILCILPCVAADLMSDIIRERMCQNSSSWRGTPCQTERDGCTPNNIMSFVTVLIVSPSVFR